MKRGPKPKERPVSVEVVPAAAPQEKTDAKPGNDAAPLTFPYDTWRYHKTEGARLFRKGEIIPFDWKANIREF